MLNSFLTKNLNCEEEAKFTHDRIQLVEKHLAVFCHTFGQYSRKAALIRDKGDAIAQAAISFAGSEDINKSLRFGLTNFASTFACIGDYGEARVQETDSKVILHLSQYENVCKQVKEEVKQIFSARDKEVVRKRQLSRIRERNPRNHQQIVQAEAELVKATAEVSKTINNLEEKVTAFEKQKLHDLKKILSTFIVIEIGYHAKALEQLTTAYNEISAIDEDADLKEFVKSLQTSNQSRPKSLSFGSINTITREHRSHSSPGIPRSALKTYSSTNISKSVETLNTTDDEISGSTHSDSDQSNNEESSVDTDDQKSIPAPVTGQKYLK